MTDSEHLMWILDRMVNVHGERPNVDYMLRLHQIARKIEEPIANSVDDAECFNVGDAVMFESSGLNVGGKLLAITNHHAIVGSGPFEEVVILSECKLRKRKTDSEMLLDKLSSIVGKGMIGSMTNSEIAELICNNYDLTPKPTTNT